MYFLNSLAGGLENARSNLRRQQEPANGNPAPDDSARCTEVSGAKDTLDRLFHPEQERASLSRAQEIAIRLSEFVAEDPGRYPSQGHAGIAPGGPESRPTSFMSRLSNPRSMFYRRVNRPRSAFDDYELMFDLEALRQIGELGETATAVAPDVGDRSHRRGSW
jgi:hypothetical protein